MMTESSVHGRRSDGTRGGPDENPDCIIHAYGSGTRSAGGSIAWCDTVSRREVVKQIGNCSPVKAHYKAFLDALESAPNDSYVHIYCSSRTLLRQFEYGSGNATSDLRFAVSAAIRERHLTVKAFYVPVSRNLAAKIIRRELKARAVASRSD